MQPQNRIWNWIACAHRLCTYTSRRLAETALQLKLRLYLLSACLSAKSTRFVESLVEASFRKFKRRGTHTHSHLCEKERENSTNSKFITRAKESYCRIASNPAEKENSCKHTHTHHLYEAKLYISASAPTKEDKTFAAKYIFYVISFCSSYG